MEFEYKNLHQVLHIELDKKIGKELCDQMITKFDVDESFKSFIDIYSTLKFADDLEKREHIKNTLKQMFAEFFRESKCENYNETCEFVNAVCKIYFQYITFKT